MESKEMNHKIDVMIAGVEKAGTTSLLRYLGEHPQIATHEAMEFPFFVRDDLYENGYDEIYNKYFQSDANGKLLLAKNVGCFYWENAAERMYAHNHNMKLIIILRNPVARAYSAYRYAVQMGREDKPTFEDAIEAEDYRLGSGVEYHKRYHAYLKRGMYAQQLERLHQYFPPKQIKIILFEELIKEPQVCLAEILQFLELAPAKIDTTIKYNETTGRESYLRALTGRYFSWLTPYAKSALPKSLSNQLSAILKSEKAGKKVPDLGLSDKTRMRLEKYYEDEIAHLEQMVPLNFVSWRSN
jgi:hypothetical protein